MFLVVQLARPGFRQIGDFMSAIYSPYTSYGQDELNRYDTYYGDYTEEAAGASRQFRHVRIINSLNSTKDFMSNVLVSQCHFDCVTILKQYNRKNNTR